MKDKDTNIKGLEIEFISIEKAHKGALNGDGMKWRCPNCDKIQRFSLMDVQIKMASNNDDKFYHTISEKVEEKITCDNCKIRFIIQLQHFPSNWACNSFQKLI
jgi:hypothetical protein